MVFYELQTPNCHPKPLHLKFPCTALQMDPQPKFVVFHELVFTSKEFMRTVTQILPEWLIEVAPHIYTKQEIQDESSKKMPKVAGRSAPTI